jgi:hypothetical protein
MCPAERTERKTNVMLRLIDGEHITWKLTLEDSMLQFSLFNF